MRPFFSIFVNKASVSLRKEAASNRFEGSRKETRCARRALRSAAVGGWVMIGSFLYTCIESQEIISTGSALAISQATAVLPEAVGPARIKRDFKGSASSPLGENFR